MWRAWHKCNTNLDDVLAARRQRNFFPMAHWSIKHPIYYAYIYFILFFILFIFYSHDFISKQVSRYLKTHKPSVGGDQTIHQSLCDIKMWGMYKLSSVFSKNKEEDSPCFCELDNPVQSGKDHTNKENVRAAQTSSMLTLFNYQGAVFKCCRVQPWLWQRCNSMLKC